MGKLPKTRGGYKRPGEDFISGYHLQFSAKLPNLPCSTISTNTGQNKLKFWDFSEYAASESTHFLTVCPLHSLCRCFNLGWNFYYQNHCLWKTKIWIFLINTVLSVEFLVFTFCALHEQEKTLFLFLSVGLEQTQQWGFQNKTTQKSLMEQSTFTLCLLLHCTLGVVLRCKRDEGLHGIIYTMEISQCWNPKFAFGEWGLNPCYVSGKKKEVLRA